MNENEIHVTETRITLLDSDRPLKAYASICLNGQFVVDNFRIIEKEGNIIVFMPKKTRKNEDGTYRNRNIAYPTDHALRSEIIDAIKNQYLEAREEVGKSDPSDEDEKSE